MKLEYYINENKKDLQFKIKFYRDELFTISYLHGGIDFSKRENRLARGLTLDKDDNIVLVGFEKFFNDKQLENYENYTEQFKQERARITDNLDEKLLCYEKLDGSMIILGVYKDRLIAGTTSSIDNEHTKTVLEHIKANYNEQAIINYLKNKNSCLILEYTGYDNMLCVEYSYKIKLTIIGEISKDTLRDIEITDTLGFEIAKTYAMTYKELLDFQKTNTELEGFVIKNKYGNRIKIKTDWWFSKSDYINIFFQKGFTTNTIMSIIQAINDNTIDDLLAFQNRSKVWKDENKVGRVLDIISSIEKETNDLLKQYQDFKSIGLSNIDKFYKSIMFIKLKGDKVDYLKHINKIKERLEN